MQWDEHTQHTFETFISRIPIFHRAITKETVRTKAEELAEARKAALVEEKDVVDAFFADVPSPFYSMMIRLMEQTGIDYRKYGYPRASRK
jgi:hypothetical protein